MNYEDSKTSAPLLDGIMIPAFGFLQFRGSGTSADISCRLPQN
jgi:hypothetical protein